MNPGLAAYLALAAAIVCETVGTVALERSKQFTVAMPSIVTVVAYGCAFFFLSLALRSIPVGIAYAIWSGIGIVLISILGLVVLGQRLDTPAILGLGLIIAGVVVINVFSRSVPHG